LVKHVRGLAPQAAQQPPSETPGTMLVRFTDPPSVDGAAGPQIGAPAAPEEAAADDTVVLAAFDDDESGASPGSCSGA
jgi:hypothetical protein